jgi:hypothetical protein
VGSVAIPKSAEGSKRESDGFVRIGVDVIFHLDVLKPSLPKGDASDVAKGRCVRPCPWRKHEETDVAGSGRFVVTSTPARIVDRYRGVALCRSGSSHEREQVK